MGWELDPVNRHTQLKTLHAHKLCMRAVNLSDSDPHPLRETLDPPLTNCTVHSWLSHLAFNKLTHDATGTILCSDAERNIKIEHLSFYIFYHDLLVSFDFVDYLVAECVELLNSCRAQRYLVIRHSNL